VKLGPVPIFRTEPGEVSGITGDSLLGALGLAVPMMGEVALRRPLLGLRSALRARGAVGRLRATPPLRPLLGM
jgi:hypothetical protein